MADIKFDIDVNTAPVDRAIRVMDNLEAEVRDVKRAFDKGLISIERHDAEIRRLTKSQERLKDVTKGSAKDFRTFEKTVYGSGKAMRQKEIAMQQAGYQLQDFIVQVQAGTNPLIAFSQQGSQLAGFFAGPWGAAIGLGIAALGGLGTALLGAKGKTEDLHGQLEELFDYLNDSQDSVKNLMETSLSGPMEKARLEAIELLKVFQKMEEPKIMEKVGSAVLPMVEKLAEAQDAIQEQRTKKSLFKTGRLSYVYPEDQRNQMLELEKNLARINESLGKAIQGPIEGMGIRLTEAFMELEKSGVLTDDLRENFKEMMISTGLQAQAQREIAEAQEKQKENQKAVTEGQKQGEEELKALVAARDAKEKARYDALIRLQDGHYAIQKREDEAYKQRMQLYYKTAGSLMQQGEQEARAEQKETSDQLYHNALLAKQNAMALDITQEQERQKLADQTHAHMMALQKAYYDDAKTKAAETASATYLANYNAVMAYQAYGQSRMAAPSEPVEPPKTKVKRDPLADLQKQLELEQALVGKTQARQRIIQALGVDFEKYGDKTINNLEAQINKTIELEEAERKRQQVVEEAKQQQEDLKNTIESSMEDAFMSIADGTLTVKDAFRQMASDIIRELYRVLVVQRLVKAATGFFGFADGGAFQGGSQIQAYANGGVVGSPTYFPMAGGKTGLMGEAGPEAIMPLKRGKDGKLGVTVDGNQQQSVNIVQNFQFSANGDDSVKRIIASEAPKIAKMTEAQILENRRRGGQFRKAFS